MFLSSSKVLNSSKTESEPLEACSASAAISAIVPARLSTSCSEPVPPMSFSSPPTHWTLTQPPTIASPPFILSDNIPSGWENHYYDNVSFQFSASNLSDIPPDYSHPFGNSAEMTLVPPETRTMQNSSNELVSSPIIICHPCSQSPPACMLQQSLYPSHFTSEAAAADNPSQDLRLDDAVIDSIISQHFECNGCLMDETTSGNWLCASDLSFPSSQDGSDADRFEPFPSAGSSTHDCSSNQCHQEHMVPTQLSSMDRSTGSDPNVSSRNNDISPARSDGPLFSSQCLSEPLEGWSESSGLQKVKQGRISRVKKKKGKITRARAKPWTAEEHRRFEESLELYGRNWEQCAKYIGTRRASLVRSHAQKHLIKLWKLGKPLPKKLAETGSGYTLSGKPLLADSASAKSYLIKLPCPEASEISQ